MNVVAENGNSRSSLLCCALPFRVARGGTTLTSVVLNPRPVCALPS